MTLVPGVEESQLHNKGMVPASDVGADYIPLVEQRKRIVIMLERSGCGSLVVPAHDNT